MPLTRSDRDVDRSCQCTTDAARDRRRSRARRHCAVTAADLGHLARWPGAESAGRRPATAVQPPGTRNLPVKFPGAIPALASCGWSHLPARWAAGVRRRRRRRRWRRHWAMPALSALAHHQDATQRRRCTIRWQPAPAGPRPELGLVTPTLASAGGRATRLSSLLWSESAIVSKDHVFPDSFALPRYIVVSPWPQRRHPARGPAGYTGTSDSVGPSKGRAESDIDNPAPARLTRHSALSYVKYVEGRPRRLRNNTQKERGICLSFCVHRGMGLTRTRHPGN
jgi:hypothetical protein